MKNVKDLRIQKRIIRIKIERKGYDKDLDDTVDHFVEKIIGITKKEKNIKAKIFVK